ncbi:deoxynucleoside kinase [Mycoplasmopsis meleagridis]|uniref:deoxynucleoside kinase n=1 Tax=Mycoplasmopsis meleagridis TaxID=29561 RepID=UPI00073D4C87|nr:deoxynucleoside kinase [Mycoplasmopsis meleagridis]KUH47401.1 deoxyguanosine kinase [Mycoplasmopsis meleagridis]
MVIAISGMIGAGKSTLSKNLHSIMKNSLLLEEFEEDNDVFNTFLKWLYEKKKNIDIGFQAYILESLSSNFQKGMKEFENLGFTSEKDYIFLDRFNLEHYIFAVVTLSKKRKKYLEAFDKMFHEIIDEKENPDLAIFLDISYETFEERILQRGRKSEIDNYEINKEYFKELHSLYKDLFINLAKRYGIAYEIINCNNKDDLTVTAEAIKIIKNFEESKK